VAEYLREGDMVHVRADPSQAADKLFLTLWDSMDSLDIQRRWTMEPYEVMNTDMPVARIRSSRLRLSRYGTMTHEFWKGFVLEDMDRKEEQRRTEGPRLQVTRCIHYDV
jgi:hypothetical protein